MTNEELSKLLKENNESLEERLAERFTKTILANNERLVTFVKAEIKASEERLSEQMKEDKRELKQEIRDSQQDTIQVLTSIMHANHDNHEARLTRVEEELHLPPLKQN